MSAIFITFAVLGSLSFGQDSPIPSPVTINTDLGFITGLQTDTYETFFAIPYTEEVMDGNNRFKQSSLRVSPYDDTPYDATTHRAMCPQEPTPFATLPLSEDCLFVDIFAPKGLQSPESDENDGLAVLVFIHGGSFVFGDASIYPGSAFMRDENVIYVSVQYRLGAFGFLSTQSILDESGKGTGGMNGIHDIIVALQWIQKNIQDFGGDPDKVTIMGQSAGGWAICWLMVSNVAKNLFKQAIIESAACVSSSQYPFSYIGGDAPFSYIDGIASSNYSLQLAGFTNDLTELRSKSVQEILSVFASPAVDGFILPSTFETNTFNSASEYDGKLNAKKLILGFNTLDTLYGYPFYTPTSIINPPQNRDDLINYLQIYGFSMEQIDNITNKYYPISDFAAWIPQDFSCTVLGTCTTISEYEILWDTMNMDVCWKCLSAEFIRVLKKRNNLYYYSFAGAAPYITPHVSELNYVFYNSINSLYPFALFTGVPWHEKLSDFMVDQWINFVVSGKPLQTQPKWKSFGNDERMIVFKDDSGVVHEKYFENYRNGVCDEMWLQIDRQQLRNLCVRNIAVTSGGDAVALNEKQLILDEIEGNVERNGGVIEENLILSLSSVAIEYLWGILILFVILNGIYCYWNAYCKTDKVYVDRLPSVVMD